jgi:hypothetical protein
MKILEQLNRRISSWFIADIGDIDNKQVRIKFGLIAGWISILAVAEDLKSSGEKNLTFL